MIVLSFVYLLAIILMFLFIVYTILGNKKLDKIEKEIIKTKKEMEEILNVKKSSN